MQCCMAYLLELSMSVRSCAGVCICMCVPWMGVCICMCVPWVGVCIYISLPPSLLRVVGKGVTTGLGGGPSPSGDLNMMLQY